MELFQNITREDILKAIQKIRREGIPNHAQSSTYDVLFEGERFPPKLVVSYANIFANGQELDRNSFPGGKGTECFTLLENRGFKIVDKKVKSSMNEKENFSAVLKKFLEQAQKGDLKTKGYTKSFQDLKVKVSFGQGALAQVPWISFLDEGQTTSKGIYPVFLYYKKYQKLVLAYGVSETYQPDQPWNIRKGVESIEKYFSEIGVVPQRYGQSYVFSVYDTSNTLDYAKIEVDLQQIIQEYKELMGKNTPFDIKRLEEDLENTGLQFEANLLKRFVVSLLTKPFVILTGLSGSGKTKLAQAFAKWICESDNQMCIVPVGADWTNREALLGYPNALCRGEYVMPENGALNLLIEATKHSDRPYFLILDEMNLSHVERYFADFLSAMESGEEIPLYPESEVLDNRDIPPKVMLPSNFFIIGTVNIDETTYMFSPKVLDRANVIEFRVTRADMEAFLKGYQQVGEIENKGSDMAESFVRMAEMKVEPSPKVGDLEETLLDYFDALKTVGAEFGYRTGAEIHRFFVMADLLVKEWEEGHVMDAVIMQKLLPKLHGSQRKLAKVLEALGKLCLKGNGDVKPYFNNVKNENNDNVNYPLSLDKIIRMYKNLESNGFTSYAEA